MTCSQFESAATYSTWHFSGVGRHHRLGRVEVHGRRRPVRVVRRQASRRDAVSRAPAARMPRKIGRRPGSPARAAAGAAGRRGRAARATSASTRASPRRVAGRARAGRGSGDSASSRAIAKATSCSRLRLQIVERVDLVLADDSGAPRSRSARPRWRARAGALAERASEAARRRARSGSRRCCGKRISQAARSWSARTRVIGVGVAASSPTRTWG